MSRTSWIFLRVAIWLWINTYRYSLLGGEHPFATYFDVHQGYMVLTHSHIYIIWLNNHTVIYSEMQWYTVIYSVYIYIYCIYLSSPSHKCKMLVQLEVEKSSQDKAYRSPRMQDVPSWRFQWRTWWLWPLNVAYPLAMTSIAIENDL